MATTTATISLNSADITGDPLSLSKTSTLTKAQGTDGLNQFTGITTAKSLVLAASYVNTAVAHKVYIRNTSTSEIDYINIELGSTNVSLGRLYGGDWAFLPWDAINDINIDTSGALTIEFGVFSQSALSA